LIIKFGAKLSYRATNVNKKSVSGGIVSVICAALADVSPWTAKPGPIKSMVLFFTKRGLFFSKMQFVIVESLSFAEVADFPRKMDKHLQIVFFKPCKGFGIVVYCIDKYRQ
jgi:hypothetical protein